MADNTQQQLNSTTDAIKELQKALAAVNGEIPQFTNSLGEGIAAVAGKLPDLVDSMIGLNAQNKELAAKGGKPKSVLSQLAGSMLSWNTAISLGATLLIT
ncbi:hypothetical protein ACFQ3S_02805 [Mucilaginibacter terrae]|uniref:hypothetical protein n=1 Tax=Mucilaginibacter terrae TaxID=1955052 RepID=UPI0036359343